MKHTEKVKATKLPVPALATRERTDERDAEHLLRPTPLTSLKAEADQREVYPSSIIPSAGSLRRESERDERERVMRPSLPSLLRDCCASERVD